LVGRPRANHKVSAVLDASVALTWCFADQATPATDLLLDEVRDFGAVVPPLWFLEVANVLLNAERRGRITAPDIAQRLDLISALPILVDQAGTGFAWTTTLNLARTEKLTPYDASYLEISLRRALPLFTRDRELADAARRRGVLLK